MISSIQICSTFDEHTFVCLVIRGMAAFPFWSALFGQRKPTHLLICWSKIVLFSFPFRRTFPFILGVFENAHKAFRSLYSGVFRHQKQRFRVRLLIPKKLQRSTSPTQLSADFFHSCLPGEYSFQTLAIHCIAKRRERFLSKNVFVIKYTCLPLVFFFLFLSPDSNWITFFKLCKLTLSHLGIELFCCFGLFLSNSPPRVSDGIYESDSASFFFPFLFVFVRKSVKYGDRRWWR